MLSRSLFISLLTIAGIYSTDGYRISIGKRSRITSISLVGLYTQQKITTTLYASSTDDFNKPSRTPNTQPAHGLVLPEDDYDSETSIDDDEENVQWAKPISTSSGAADTGARDADFFQNRDLDLILTERATRFYDPKLLGVQKERCILVAVDKKLEERRANARALTSDNTPIFSLQESLSELSELVGTAGLEVMGCCIQRRYTANSRTYVGSGKVADIMTAVNATGTKTLVIDDDLTPKQQRSLEDALGTWGGKDVKVLDRTAVILEIFAQHAKSREGQLQVELAMLEYRLTRGPRASGGDGDSGCGFRGPGETKVETDKRVIKEKILLVEREIGNLGMQREQHRKSRMRLGLPVVALVGYTNAGKSTLLNRLSRAGVLAENMLFATLDPTTRRVQLPKSSSKNRGSSEGFNSGSNQQNGDNSGSNGDSNSDDGSTDSDGDDSNIVEASSSHGVRNKGQEVLLTDTVGFISKLPTDLIAAFRATLEEVSHADVLVHVIDRSSPVWEKQRETVIRELDAIGCTNTPIVEFWNKIDNMKDPEEARMEAMCVPVDVEALVTESDHQNYQDDDEDEDDSEDSERKRNEQLATTILATDTSVNSGASDAIGASAGSTEGTTSSVLEGIAGVKGGKTVEFPWDKESWTKKARDEKGSRGRIIEEEDSYVWSEEDEYVRAGPPGEGGDDEVEKEVVKEVEKEAVVKKAKKPAMKKKERVVKPASVSPLSKGYTGDVNSWWDEDEEEAERETANKELGDKDKEQIASYNSQENSFDSSVDDADDDDENEGDSNSGDATEGEDLQFVSLKQLGKSSSTVDEEGVNSASRPVKRASLSERVRPSRKTFVVAASAKTGIGFDDFLETLESALSLLLKPTQVFIPFTQDDGIIAMIHSQGVVDTVEYNNVGTSLKCRVPPALWSRLQKFKVKKSSATRN